MVSILNRQGKEQFVNPEFVTSVMENHGKDIHLKECKWREVWVVGNSGYGTFRIETDELAQELAIRLEKK